MHYALVLPPLLHGLCSIVQHCCKPLASLAVSAVPAVEADVMQAVPPTWGSGPQHEHHQSHSHEALSNLLQCSTSGTISLSISPGAQVCTGFLPFFPACVPEVSVWNQNISARMIGDGHASHVLGGYRNIDPRTGIEHCLGIWRADLEDSGSGFGLGGRRMEAPLKVGSWDARGT
jgi:hypothetical protein